MSKVTERGAVTPTMNITPLIDVVFLLIIFFMLVNNIVTEEVVEMELSQLDGSKAREIGELNRVVVNIAPQDFSRDGRQEAPLEHVGTPAYVKVGTGSNSRFELGDIEGITGRLREVQATNPEVEVLLRADAAIFYNEVRPIMNAVTAAGIETVNLVAYRPEE